MIIFLYGRDTYRSRRKLNDIIEKHRLTHKSGLNLKYFDKETVAAGSFQEEVQSISMFAEKKLIVLKNVFSDKAFREYFLENQKQFISSKDIILFYEDEDVSAKDVFLKFLKKYAKTQEFNLLDGIKLRNWVDEEFSRYSSDINRDAADILIDYAGNDLWRLSNEIQKIATFKAKCNCELGLSDTGSCAGPEDRNNLSRPIIEEKDIRLLVKPKIESDIFKTIDALAVKNKKQAINLLHKHFEKGDSPLYLLSMINFQFRNLIVIKDLIEKNIPYYVILEKSKMHPFVVRKSYQQAGKFTFQELKKIYQKIFEADLNIKTGRVDPQTALDLLIAEA